MDFSAVGVEKARKGGGKLGVEKEGKGESEATALHLQHGRTGQLWFWTRLAREVKKSV
jgi:hypothetical protein